MAIALVLLSAHLFLGIYPLPSQQAAEIERRAEDADRLEKKFQIPSLKPEGVEGKRRWAEALTREYWMMWGLNVLGIALSFTAAFLAFSASRWWSWTALGVCLLFLVTSGPPVIAMSIDAGGFSHYASVVAHAHLKDGVTLYGLLGIYNLIVLPVAYAVLSIVIIFVFLHERRHQKRLESNPRIHADARNSRAHG